MSINPDAATLGDSAHAGAEVRSFQGVQWRCDTRVEKFHVDDFHSGREPYETVDVPGNLLLLGGADVLWLGLRDGLSGTSGLANTKYNNGNAALGVGDSNTAAASSQTDLQASSGVTHRRFKGMDATFPTHTTGTAASTDSKILFKSTFTSSQSNFAWQEWGVSNKVSVAAKPGGRLLNRKVQSLGTKTSAGVWALTVTLSLA